MPCGVSFCWEEICHKDLYTYWQDFQTSYYYFFYFGGRSSILFSLLYFSSISKKKSLKYNNVIIKTGCFYLSFTVLFSLHWQLNFLPKKYAYSYAFNYLWMRSHDQIYIHRICEVVFFTIRYTIRRTKFIWVCLKKVVNQSRIILCCGLNEWSLIFQYNKKFKER